MSDKPVIVVEASCLRASLTGIGTFVFTALEALRRREVEIILVSNSHEIHRYWRLGKTISPFPQGKMNYVLYLLFFRFFIRRFESPTVWAPAHRLPFFLNENFGTVLTIHDFCAFLHENTMQLKTILLDRVLLPRSISKADRVSFVSYSMLEEALAFFPKQGSTFSIGYPEVNFFFDRSRSGKTIKVAAGRMRKIRLLMVGSFEPRKRIVETLHIVGWLPRLVESVLIVGAYGWNDVYERVEEIRRVCPVSVTICRDASDEFLVDAYGNVDALLVGSCYEGFCLPLLDALGASVPVIAPKVNIFEEVLGNAGLYYDSSDGASLESKIEFLCRLDDKLYRDFLQKSVSRRRWWQSRQKESISDFLYRYAIGRLP